MTSDGDRPRGATGVTSAAAAGCSIIGVVTILDSLDIPIVLAPMAAGAGTPSLAAAVSNAGGLGFVAAGYLTADALREQIVATRELTGRPFGVNVFVPGTDPVDQAAVAAYRERLAAEADRYGVPLGEPVGDDDHWDAKLAVLREERVPLASFTFGCPTPEVVAELRAAGTEADSQRCDVSDLAAVEALAAATLDRFGAAHVLCNNAGIGIPTPTHKLNLDDWRWIIDVDLWGPIHGVKVFLPIMEEQGEGHINATSSMAGLFAAGMMGAYNAAKHAVVALQATLERDMRARKSPVRASVLCPGPINTNISRHSVAFRPSRAKPKADGEASGRTAAAIQNSLESGMDPDEVGRLVLDAVQRDRFWVLTHPDMARGIQLQVEAMMAERRLTRG